MMNSKLTPAMQGALDGLRKLYRYGYRTIDGADLWPTVRIRKGTIRALETRGYVERYYMNRNHWTLTDKALTPDAAEPR